MRKPVPVIDLHCHSTASDSDRTPTQLVEHAKKLGLQTVAITDHDTIDGVEEAMEAGKRLGVTVIPGIELSADFPNGTMHILGYHIDTENPVIKKDLAEKQEYRAKRSLIMIDRLNGMADKNGKPIQITREEVAEVASGTSALGRPHIATVLMNKGHVGSVKEAFATLLSEKSPAYLPNMKMSPAECINLIHQAGGIAVLAHPYQTRLSGAALDEKVGELAKLGLRGIETFYSLHSEEQTKEYEGLAAKYNLVKTGGSDWHGSIKPNIEMGSGVGDLFVPPSVLEDIERALPSKPLAMPPAGISEPALGASKSLPGAPSQSY